MVTLFLASEFKKVSRGGEEALRLKEVGEITDMKNVAPFLSVNLAPLRVSSFLIP